MLYILQFRDFIKLGWTTNWPQRARRGFWHVVYPPELCGKLNQYEVIHMFEGGSQELEKALHKSLRGVGEFYTETQLSHILQSIREHNLQEVETPAYSSCEVIIKQACCGGKTHTCFNCDRTFKRSEHLWRHIKNIHKKK